MAIDRSRALIIEQCIIYNHWTHTYGAINLFIINFLTGLIEIT